MRHCERSAAIHKGAPCRSHASSGEPTLLVSAVSRYLPWFRAADAEASARITLRGRPPPQGPSLREAYLPFNIASALAVLGLVALAAWVRRARLIAWSVALLLVAVTLVAILQVMGLNARMLSAFAPDVALVMTVALVLLCLPAALGAGSWTRRFIAGSPIAPPT